MKTVLFKVAAVALILFGAAFLLKSVGVAQMAAKASFGNVDHLTIQTEDGLTLHAWKSEADPDSLVSGARPGLALLLPMMSMTHESYEPFIRRLNEIGYTTVAFDLRGHGQSIHVGNRTISFADMDESGFVKMPGDVAQFFAQFAPTHPDDYNYDDVVIIGASIGANTAGLLLGRDWVTRAALLSPGRDYRGLTPETALTPEANPVDKPVYIAVTVDDTYAAESSQWLFDHYRGPKVLKRYPGQQHGTDMLRYIEGADHELLDWLRSK